jgi:NAD+ synthase
MKVKLPDIDCEQVANEIGAFIIDQCSKHVGAVIGLSGGIDSSLVAFLAQRAFDKQKWQKGAKRNKLICVYIPTSKNSEDSKRLAEVVADQIGATFIVINIEESVNSLSDDITDQSGIDGDIDKKIYGNMISRHRANVLWTIAAIENCIVLGTGNADEDFGVGYYTLGGDGLVSCSPIGVLSKRLVYELAQWVEIPHEIVNRKPTAELETNQTDEDDLGYKYVLVELMMEAMRHPTGNTGETAQRRIWIEYEDFIRENITEKWALDPFKALIDITVRHEGAIYKQGIVNPPIAKVTLKY